MCCSPGARRGGRSPDAGHAARGAAHDAEVCGADRHTGRSGARDGDPLREADGGTRRRRAAARHGLSARRNKEVRLNPKNVDCSLAAQDETRPLREARLRDVLTVAFVPVPIFGWSIPNPQHLSMATQRISLAQLTLLPTSNALDVLRVP